LAQSNPTGQGGEKPTTAGCIVTLLTLVVILGMAISIVQWRDAATERPLPQDVAIAAPFLVGAVFFWICTVLLKLVGLRIWSQPEKEDADPPNA